MTSTQICNLALSRIGARRIASVETDTTVEALACRQWFPLTRDGLLRRHQWDFAKATQRLVLDLDEELVALSGWPACYEVPSDCVRIISLNAGSVQVTRFERHQRKILADDYEELKLLYVSNGVVSADWDSLFVEALVLKLAARIAGDVTQNPALAAECNTEFEQLALPTAQTADAREASSGEGFGLLEVIGQSTLGRLRRLTRANLIPVTQAQIDESTTVSDWSGEIE